MMDWNKGLVEKSKHWDGVADYPVEYGNRASRGESKRQ